MKKVSNNGLVADSRDFTDKYNTKLTPEQESAFQLWATVMSNKLGRNILNDLYDYDMKGAFLEGLTPNGDLHWDDKFKKPNHKTFSNQSIYHGIDGYYGGEWSKDSNGNVTYSVSPTNMFSKQELQDYMNRAEAGVSLVDKR